MKRILYLSLVAVILLFAGCSKKPTEKEPDASSSMASQVSQVSEPEPPPVVTKGEIANVDEGSYVNVRQSPSMEGEIIGKALLGESFVVDPDSSTEEWKQIDFNGKIGYIYKDYIILTES